MSDERDGVALTHLDQPLFDGADATKQDLVDYLDTMRDRIIPVLRGPAAVGDAGPARPGTVHAEEPAQVRAGVGPDRPGVGRRLPPDDHLPAGQRPAHAGVVRQPAGRRVPRGAGPGRPRGPAHPSDSGHRPARAGALRPGRPQPPTWSAGRWRSWAWPVRSRPAARRACTSSSRSTGRRPRSRWPRQPGPSGPGPSASTRPWPRRPSSARTGRARCSSTPPGPAGRRWPRPTARGSGPGSPVSCPVAWDDLDDVTPRDFTLHTAPGLLGDGDPWTSFDAAASAPEPGADRRRRRHPHRPGPGHARRQAPEEGQPRDVLRPTGRPAAALAQTDPSLRQVIMLPVSTQ